MMATVKITSFTRSRQAAKKSVRYFTHRPGNDKRQTSREILGIDGVLEKHQAYQMIDRAAKGTVFFRIVISPDPQKEDSKKDLYLQSITEHTMLALDDGLKKNIQFLAVTHSDHTDIRHVHVMACVKERIEKPDLKALREAATEAALFQRQELDLARAAKQREIEEAQWQI